jgi:beta-lactamase superfamily II metal-dependent hydrolase
MANAFPRDAINVRMYDVGFGDCLLLSFPIGDGHRHVLVDCGCHVQGSNNNLRQVAEHIGESTGQHLSAVVATHRHQDHIWGFERGRDVFRRITIDEIWLPWVEEVGNTEARAVWRAHDALRAALQAQLAAANAGPRRDTIAAVLANLQPNQIALEELRNRFGRGPQGVRYLHGASPDIPSAAGIDGLLVKVLGPPKSEEFLKRMNPPRLERWARAAAANAANDAVDGEVTEADLVDAPFDERWEDSTKGEYWSTTGAHVFGKDERELFTRAIHDRLDLAFALEDAVNNSSLVLLFAFGGQSLLMPGDAQWGNWQSWIQSERAATLFEQITLYKAGHHGSHNATPRSVVDRLPANVKVLVPTHRVPYPTIPDPKLMASLDTRSGHRVVRSDQTGQLPTGFERGTFWIDCRLEVA